MSYNKLTVLPEAIGQFSHLLRLNLARNNLKDMPESMREMTSLNIIDLSYNDFLSFPKAITARIENYEFSEDRIYCSTTNKISRFTY